MTPYIQVVTTAPDRASADPLLIGVLAAVPMRRDDHAARDVVGNCGAQLGAHEVEAGVDARSRARVAGTDFAPSHDSAQCPGPP